MYSGKFFANPLTQPRHDHLRLLIQTSAQSDDGNGVFLMSKSDLVQLAAGRKPCGKMGVNPDRPGFLFISERNMQLMGNEGVRCSWQTGDNTPVEHQLSPAELSEQALTYSGGLHRTNG